MEYYENYWEENEKWSPSDGGMRETEELLLKGFYETGLKLADYGCGNGRRYAKKLISNRIDYVGFDISKQAIAIAKSEGLNAETLTQDGKTSLLESSIDAACCFEVLEHLMNPENAVRELFRILKVNGVLILSVPNPGYLPYRIEFLLRGFLVPGGSPETSRKTPWNDAHIRFFSTWSLKKLLKAEGFEEIEIIGERFSAGDFPLIYRLPVIRKIAKYVSYPISWLGRLSPALFSGTLYVRATKS